MKSTALKILVLDRNAIGHDLNWTGLSNLGSLDVLDAVLDADLPAILNQYKPHVVVSNRPQIGEEALGVSPLELVCLTATGTNTVDLAAARAHSIAVCNIVGYSTESVAQHTFALVLELINHTGVFDHIAKRWPEQHNKPWTDLSHSFYELHGKTWGIIGMGTIGRRVAALAAAFGCKVVWASTGTSIREESWPRIELEDLLAASDIVSIHSPFTEASRNLIHIARLTLMKPSAFLVNVGRGGIINEIDLALALNQNLIAGAALDVLLPEPPQDNNPLFSLHPTAGRLLLTPHIAWAAVEARQRALDETVKNIDAWLQGERRNRVD